MRLYLSKHKFAAVIVILIGLFITTTCYSGCYQGCNRVITVHQRISPTSYGYYGPGVRGYYYGPSGFNPYVGYWGNTNVIVVPNNAYWGPVFPACKVVKRCYRNAQCIVTQTCY